MSLPTNFFIGRLGLSKTQDFIWAVTHTTGSDMNLYQLNSETLAVEAVFNVGSTYSYGFRAHNGSNNLVCDDDGNLYLFVERTDVSNSAWALVSFSPTGQRRWEQRFGVTGNFDTLGGYNLSLRYRKSDGFLYAFVPIPGRSSSFYRISTDGSSYTNFSHNNTTYGSANNASSVRCFEVFEDYPVVIAGGQNTSSTDYMYASSFTGSSMTSRHAVSHNGGFLSMGYSPAFQGVYYSGQYNNDDIRYTRLSNPSSFSFQSTVLAYPGSYMYGGAITADSHPLFSANGGAIMPSYYDANPSYVIQGTSPNSFTMDGVFGNTQSSGQNAGTYNPFNQRFYIPLASLSGYGSPGKDLRSFKMGSTISPFPTNHFFDVVNASSNWQTQNPTSRKVSIQHSSSRATQNGL